MNAAPSIFPAPPPARVAPVCQPTAMRLTRVVLAAQPPRFTLCLRFGEPACTLRLDRWRRLAVFLPHAVFGRLRWQARDDGTAHWQLLVMQACPSRESVRRIGGVQPGARLLLHAEGDRGVRAVLERIDAIEALGIAPAAVLPAYWRTLGHRLAARAALPVYNAEWHAAWLARQVQP
ncbi:DUF2840 domain-containing protein [Stenotrophomonas maltophilia]|uniref:DUF2840 domain-containing protein n=1 Tax=Stenotrophomonas maltophilia TaxID=40324 RepID=UPI00209AE48A|nr:DUF2840 domain-containing protein [Stenotrophomonas maltophilia]MCO7486978.1 DUF2840 domain-containing protein [Stenotrophomonas maltophilia]